MEDWEIVSIESELDRLRDEKEKSKIVPAATGKSSNLSFGKMFLYFILGMIIFKLFSELLFIFK
jgi:hypothetical protein